MTFIHHSPFKFSPFLSDLSGAYLPAVSHDHLKGQAVFVLRGRCFLHRNNNIKLQISNFLFLQQFSGKGI